MRLVWYTNRSSNLFYPQTPGCKSQLQHKTGKVHYSLSVKRCSTSGSRARRWVASINTVWREHVLQGFFSPSSFHLLFVLCFYKLRVNLEDVPGYKSPVFNVEFLCKSARELMKAFLRHACRGACESDHVSRGFQGVNNVSSSFCSFTILPSDPSLWKKKKMGRGLWDGTIPV